MSAAHIHDVQAPPNALRLGPRTRRLIRSVARVVNPLVLRFAGGRHMPVLVNGEAGALFGTHDDPVAVIGFTIAGGRIAELNLVADPAKLHHLTIEP